MIIKTPEKLLETNEMFKEIDVRCINPECKSEDIKILLKGEFWNLIGKPEEHNYEIDLECNGCGLDFKVSIPIV